MKSKMYILVRDKIPLGFAINSTAHAALSCYLQFKDDPRAIEWLANSYAKVVCRVTDEQLDLAMKINKDYTIITESALKGEIVCVAFCPKFYPDSEFKAFKLYKCECHES